MGVLEKTVMKTKDILASQPFLARLLEEPGRSAGLDPS
jgi:hypothetical protein